MANDPTFPLFKAIRRTFSNSLVLAALLLIPARTIHWWRAWVLIVFVLLGSVLALMFLIRDHKDLLKERLKPLIQKGQPAVDRVLLITFLLSYYAFHVFIPLDVFRLHLLPEPGLVISSLGLVLVAVGWRIVFLTFRENAYAAPVVKHQVEREHHVVDTGVYSVVRHPMYSGLMLAMIGTALWLESYAAALLAFIPFGILTFRIMIEERFLMEKLQGYTDYTNRVRYRLVPLLW